MFFTGETPTPCAGGAMVSGPFYCPETGTAALDLAFLDVLGRRLQRQESLGLALVAARLARSTCSASSACWTPRRCG